MHACARASRQSLSGRWELYNSHSHAAAASTLCAHPHQWAMATSLALLRDTPTPLLSLRCALTLIAHSHITAVTTLCTHPHSTLSHHCCHYAVRSPSRDIAHSHITAVTTLCTHPHSTLSHHCCHYAVRSPSRDIAHSHITAVTTLCAQPHQWAMATSLALLRDTPMPLLSLRCAHHHQRAMATFLERSEPG